MAIAKIDLWIDRKESQLLLERDQLAWRLQGKLKDRIPLRYLNSITVLGQTQLDSRLLCRLTENGISVYFLDNARNSAGTSISQTFTTPPQHRLLQYQCYSDKNQQMSMARMIVFGKLHNYHDVGSRYFNFSDDQCKTLKNAMIQTSSSVSISQLMGIEGSASRFWFAQLKESVPEEWGFVGRNKNPPRDPVNALLSLSYTLTTQPLRQALMAHGFDLMLGFLHQITPARESMVCDLQEWLRPLIDAWVIQQVLQRFEPCDFNHNNEYGCRLFKEKRTVFYHLWYDKYENWPALQESPKTTVSLPELCSQIVMQFHKLIDGFSTHENKEWQENLSCLKFSFPVLEYSDFDDNDEEEEEEDDDDDDDK